MNDYKPPYQINSKIVSMIAEISERLGAIKSSLNNRIESKLRRKNRIKSIQSSLAIEGNSLTFDQISAVLDEQIVLAPQKEIQEARNAIKVYEALNSFEPTSAKALLKAHSTLMLGLVDELGIYRSSGIGIQKGEQVLHVAPPAQNVLHLMNQLLDWLANSDEHPLIASSVFHYEFEFIHPFQDGNGRMGRLWQTLILSQWNELFEFLPIENIIHKHQQKYYDVLNSCNASANSTTFIEFMLSVILQTLDEYLQTGEIKERSSTYQIKPPSGFQEIVDKLIEFRDERDWEQFHNAKDLALALNIESSELLELFLWKRPEDADTEKIKEELADIFAYAFLISEKYGFDVKEIILDKIRKNGEKYPVDKSKGSATKYNEL